jgi:hypothetical protein
MPETPATHSDTLTAPGGRRLAFPAEDLWHRWKAGQWPDVRQVLADGGELAPTQAAALLQVDQRERWRRGESIPAGVLPPALPAYSMTLKPPWS